MFTKVELIRMGVAVEAYLKKLDLFAADKNFVQEQELISGMKNDYTALLVKIDKEVTN